MVVTNCAHVATAKLMTGSGSGPTAAQLISKVYCHSSLSVIINGIKLFIESRNPVTALGKSFASALEKTSDIGQRQSQDSSISRTDIPSTG